MSVYKSIKLVCNYLLGLLLFGWMAFSIVQQVRHQPHLDVALQHICPAFSSPRMLLLVAVALLATVNWGLEARKWQLSVKHIVPVSFSTACKAILSGVAAGMGTPNRVGEHAGRMLYLPGGRRLQSLPATVQGGLGQLLVTLYAGLAGLYVLHRQLRASGLLSQASMLTAAWLLAVGTMLLTVFYFQSARMAPMLRQLLRKTPFASTATLLQQVQPGLLIKLLWLSLLRYFVFVVQYLLLFFFFDIQASVWMLAAATSVLFLALAVVPTIALAEVGLRGKLSLLIAGMFTTNSLGVVLAATSAWMLNLMLPALAGSIFMLGSRLFKQRSTKDERHFAVAGTGRVADEKISIQQ